VAHRHTLRHIRRMAGTRLDQLLVLRGLAESREKAQRLIMAGKVRVAGNVSDKPGKTFAEDCEILIEQPERFVSRGGEKMEGAFLRFGLNVEGLICLDVGASTGGFTDCLLQHGASRVYSVDVGKNQLHPKIRNDPRVVAIDGVNARYIESSLLPEKPSFACIDVSFISLTLVLPAALTVLASPATIVTLIKPQFEAGRGQVGKGGVVRDERIREEVVERIREFGVTKLGLEFCGVCESPIKGPAGNVEFLACWKKNR
jgi:23S rRNA (cytidine1920-2'-O)/16S rRNA (cytidine1409-2'-O)-methyltransferase